MKKIALMMIIPLLFMGVLAPVASAEETGMKQAAKSLLIPGWGQYDNGEFNTESGKVKVGVMAAIEVAAIVTTAVVGGVCGAPLVWIGVGLFIANHVWSSMDAFMNSKKEPGVNLGTSSAKDKKAVA